MLLIKKRHTLIFTMLCVFSLGSASQIVAQKQDSIALLHNKRIKNLSIIAATGYTFTMIGLGTMWYQDFEKFHFFNDNDGWGYMDKFGHSTTSQQMGRLGKASLKWAGASDQKAIWYGGLAGFGFQTSIEIFDGFSPGWGFSVGDMLANAIGTSLFIGQELKFNNQPMLLKYSFSPSKYAQYRPELLGKNIWQQWLKDYNGQIIWLSINPSGFSAKEGMLAPWLNIAAGYGIEGYTGANRNPSINSEGKSIPVFSRYSQFYISPDIDLSKIRSKSPFLNHLLTSLSFIKVPLPGISYDQFNKVQFHWLLF